METKSVSPIKQDTKKFKKRGGERFSTSTNTSGEM
jgi:hypothetical protein